MVLRYEEIRVSIVLLPLILFHETIKIRGNNPILTLKTQHFPSYLIDINSDFFQTFITGFHFMRHSK